jgi:hypothetical protein
MFRWICVCALLSAGGIAAVWFLLPHLNSAPWTDQPAPKATAADNKQPRAEAPDAPVPPAPVQRAAPVISTSRGQPEIYIYTEKKPTLVDPILIPNCELDIIEKQEVPSEKEGVLVFAGTDVKAGEDVPPEKQLPAAHLGFLAVPAAEGDKPQEGETFFHLLPNDARLFRRIRENDQLLPKKLFLARENRPVRKLQIGDWVKRGQLVGLIKTDKAFEEAASKVALLDAKEWERYAAMKQKEEYARRYKTQVETNQRTPGAIPLDDMMATLTQREKFASDEKVKEAEIVQAQRAISAALTDLKMHEIHAAIDGVIKAIYKNEQGDAVKQGMTAIVEASRPEHPRLVISGHLRTVNCVAVSKGEQPIIVSGSDDETLRGWDAQTGERLWLVSGLRSAVRSVACTPPAAKRDLVYFGCGDGTVRMLDLGDLNKGPHDLAERHANGPVNGVAFSPKGQICATCGDDHSICLWKTETGELLHRLPRAHNGPVTSVQFASDKRLVSAGVDKRLMVWDVENPRLARRVGSFESRGGEVPTIGTSPDGRLVLLDQGREIRLLTLADKLAEGTLQNSSEAGNFSTMALFSPDGKTILTQGSGAGKLQLWRTPVTTSRGAELRQFVWTKGAATCGAFAPRDGSFAVTGTQDHEVLVWTMPSKEEVETPLTAHLMLVEKQLDTRSRQVRVWAELQSPKQSQEWLVPGMRATMVILPPQK